MTVKKTPIPYKDPPLPDEAMLVRKAKAGDDHAFTRLYDGYVERVYRFILFRISDDTVTEDLVSQVFPKSLAKPGSLQNRQFALYRLVVHDCEESCD